MKSRLTFGSLALVFLCALFAFGPAVGPALAAEPKSPSCEGLKEFDASLIRESGLSFTEIVSGLVFRDPRSLSQVLAKARILDANSINENFKTAITELTQTCKSQTHEKEKAACETELRELVGQAKEFFDIQKNWANSASLDQRAHFAGIVIYNSLLKPAITKSFSRYTLSCSVKAADPACTALLARTENTKRLASALTEFLQAKRDNDQKRANELVPLFACYQKGPSKPQ